jgi:hypothetical protein
MCKFKQGFNSSTDVFLSKGRGISTKQWKKRPQYSSPVSQRSWEACLLSSGVASDRASEGFNHIGLPARNDAAQHRTKEIVTKPKLLNEAISFRWCTVLTIRINRHA